MIYNNNNNGRLFRYLKGNLNIEQYIIIISENINIYNSICVIEIIEDSSNNINDNNSLERYNFIKRNIKICENSAVLYYSYSKKLSYNVAIYSSKFIDNLIN